MSRLESYGSPLHFTFLPGIPTNMTEIQLTRRAFLGGSLVLGAVAVMPKWATKLLPETYTLWGDGIHDDSPALNALLNGKAHLVDIRDKHTHMVGRTIHISSGTYLLGSMIYIPNGLNGIIEKSYFTATPEFNRQLKQELDSMMCRVRGMICLEAHL